MRGKETWLAVPEFIQVLVLVESFWLLPANLGVRSKFGLD